MTTQNEVTKGRVAARAARLANPRQPRMGKIKLGYQIKKCFGCSKKVRAVHDKCPDCGGAKFGNSYPSKTNHYVFYEDGIPSEGHKVYLDHPTVLDFTFQTNPVDCVEISYVCYQGGKLWCKNRFEPVHATGEYVNRGVAVREGKEIQCTPLTCPMRVGGNVTVGGKSRMIPADRPQCGEKVTMNVWLPKLPGFDSYQHQSGSIATINNIQTAIVKLTGLMKGGYLPLKLQLKLQKVHGSYPDATGKPIKTEFYASYIHFPFAFDDLVKRARLKEVVAEDIMYTLPETLIRPALPGPREDTYDELIDGSRALPAEPKTIEPTAVSDLQGVAQPATEQAYELAQEIKDEINGLFDKAIKGLSAADKKKFGGKLKKTFNLAAIGAIKTVPKDKGYSIIDWLNLEIEAKDRRAVDSREIDI